MATAERPLLQALRQRLQDYRFQPRIQEQGRVLSVGDGIAWIEGLPSAAMDDLLDFEDGSIGVVFALGERHLGAILLEATEALTAGTVVHRSGRLLSIPVGDALIGRVVDPLGKPLDGGEAPACTQRLTLDAPSPPIIARDFVQTPLYTGCKIVDTMIPIGRGQRQLIIGDEGTGRSSLAIDAVIHQRGQNVLCVYVLVGQKRSAVVSTIDTLRRYGAMDYTTVVVGEAFALPGLKYLAPMAGCAIAEYWMRRGRDTLVVYDDLSTHAYTYRELSLLLRRPPGREAYPGDIFYLHSRLLERSTRLAADHGGGSMTCLPIVETQQGDIAAYIPTNLISITDGQIYLDPHLAASGFRPAIDIGRSVSRIGGKAQHPRIKEEAGRMKLDYLQFLELEVFTRFGAKLEESMARKLHRGRILREILKQDRLHPLPIAFQIAWLIAFNEGLFDALQPAEVSDRLVRLEARVRESGLGLDDPREVWLAHLKRWLA
ncbi:F-type H+-transporting ATPase subunit alpha [Methylomarinovum caldicuralii]|uniref:ATP synthase subunit alpha n=1 Tax=Methylomarinovum caldicuralii TaxID=438856 RepID=A0AAU9C2L0_9GAMM|nr:F0F1 ATP synthase subunit alpha [Methylomarinovum caldicuralii]BCX81838.1 F-type H+-transporting ATPase subunit alpha [Methylomarinovum caldicuralii]